MNRIEMTDQEILSYLNKIAVEILELEPERIRRLVPEQPLAEAFELDSVAQLVFLTQIEDGYGFVFEMEDGEGLRTIADLVQIIRERAVRVPQGFQE